MNYMKVLVLGLLCATSFLSHGMKNKPTQESIDEANSKLWFAIRNNDLAKVEQIIAEGVADINHVDKDGCTTLMNAAAFHNNANIVNALIKARANVNSIDKHGYTALIWAAYNTADNADIVNALIKADADVNSVNKYGYTALMRTITRNDNIDIVNALIKAGADVNIVNEDGNTALMRSVYHKNFNISIQIINPSQKTSTRKKLETLLVMYNKNCAFLSLLPKEVLKIIITCMHPEEFAMDRELICSLHSQALVDNIPLENLAILVKDGTLNQDTILAAWQKKLNGIIESLRTEKKIEDNNIQEFATEALKKITKLLTQ